MKDDLYEMEKVVDGRLSYSTKDHWVVYTPEALTKSLLFMRRSLKHERERAEKAEAKLEAVRKLVLAVADIEGWSGGSNADIDARSTS